MSGICSCASNSRISASGICRPASLGTTCQRRKVSYSPVSRSTGDADVDLAAVQLLRGRRQRRLDGPEDDIALDALLARDRVHQHQHFAVHRSCLRQRLCCGAAFRHGVAPGSSSPVPSLRRRPLKSTTGTSRASRTSSKRKSSACSPLSFARPRAASRPPSARPSTPRQCLRPGRAASASASRPGPAKRCEVGLGASAAGPGRATRPRAARSRRLSTSSTNCSWRVTRSQSSTVTNSPSSAGSMLPPGWP